jgi:hypothetical protein
MVMDDIATIGHWMNSRRANPLELAAKSLHYFPPAEQDRRWEQAVKSAAEAFAIDPDVVLRFIEHDIEGMAMSVWTPLERVYPGRFTFAAVKEYIVEEGSKNTAEFRDLRDKQQQINGLDAVGNSSGQSPTPPTNQPIEAVPAAG